MFELSFPKTRLVLQSTFARMAFPCWDEPIYKAHFNITLEVAAGLTALSNMPEASVEERPGTGTQVVRFTQTPLMSTYLVAWAIGDLEYIEVVCSA